MLVARVSNIEAFRRWREDDETSIDDLIRSITTDEPSPAMMAGTAFHKAMETAEFGEHDTLKVGDYLFHLNGGEIELPPIREMRGEKAYGDLMVSGQVDALRGRKIIDHKTTCRFDAERYLAGVQWRYYLDIFDADEFQWNVFEIKEIAPNEYAVSPPQTLRAFRYPDMHDDCARLARDYLGFANTHLIRTPEPLPPIAQFLMAG